MAIQAEIVNRDAEITGQSAAIAAQDEIIIDRDALIGRKEERIQRLEKLVQALKQALYGRKSEKLNIDQCELSLEDIETAMAVILAEDAAIDPPKPSPEDTFDGTSVNLRKANRGSLPDHLPRVEIIIKPASMVCRCGSSLHCMGEDVSERLNIIPAQFQVIVTRRPKYACRSCTDCVVQAPAPARLIEGGMPTEATVAHVLVSKYADHLPLYRQAHIYSRQGVNLDRSTLGRRSTWLIKSGRKTAAQINVLEQSLI